MFTMRLKLRVTAPKQFIFKGTGRQINKYMQRNVIRTFDG